MSSDPSPAESSAPPTTLTDNSAASRFEIHVDGRLGGIAAYTRSGSTITFTHTEITPEFEGHGLGGKLAEFGLDTARSEGLSVVPRCPFIAGWIGRHPAYADLVVSGLP